MEQSEILAAEDAAENLDGQKEGIPRMDPVRVVLVEAAGRNHAVEMRMQAQVLSPGVQDAEEADSGSEMLGIGCDFEHGLSGGAEEQIVEQARMSLTEWVQGVRQSEYDVEVGYGEQILLTPREPALTRLRLTLRAVPVAARVYMAPGATTRDENRYYPGGPEAG